MTHDGGDVRRPPAPRPQRWLLSLLTVLLLLSLGLHLWTLLTLQRIRLLARDELTLLSGQLAGLRTEVLTLELPVQQTVQIDTTIPVRQQLIIPVDTTITLNEQISVPLETGLGRIVVPVPVRAEVPVRVTVPVTIDETVPVRVPVTLDLRVPVHLSLRMTPLAGYLEQLQLRLATLAKEL